MLRKPNIQGQITIPKKILKRINFNPATDYFNITLYENLVILAPVVVKPKYTKQELKKIEKLFRSDKNKGVAFPSQEALTYLKSKIKKK